MGPFDLRTPQPTNNIDTMQFSSIFVLCLLGALVLGSPIPESNELVEPYSYAYEVRDPETNNFYNKAEVMTKTGDVIGSYSVLMPDGEIYTVTYNVIDDQGYNATLQITEPVRARSNVQLEVENNS